MTEQDIIIALVKLFGTEKNILLPNASFGIGLNYEADLMVITNRGYSTEIEVKITESDLLNDFKKKNFHNCRKNKYLYYAVPESMKDFALSKVPEQYGIYIIEQFSLYRPSRAKTYLETNYRAKCIRKAKCIPNSQKFTKEEMEKMYRLVYLRYWNNLVKDLKFYSNSSPMIVNVNEINNKNINFI